MSYLRAGYFWVMAFLVTFVHYSHCGLLNLRVVLLNQPRDGRAVHRAASRWGRHVIKLMPGWKVTVTGRENLPPDGTPMVIVANHESMADIWAMYYLGVQFRWLSKDSVFRLIMVGRAMKWANYVPVNRKSRESGAEAMRASADRLRQGLCMFFFPEGTRSPDGKLRDFKLGAFKLARDSQVPVLPIAIHGAGELLRKGSKIPADHAHVRITVLKPLPPPAAGEEVDGYAARVRDLLISAHAGLLT